MRTLSFGFFFTVTLALGGCGGGGTDAGVDSGPFDAGPGGCQVVTTVDGEPATDQCGSTEVCDCVVTESCPSFPCERCLARGECVDALPRVYRFFPIEVSLPIDRPGGGDWDEDGSPPDPIVQITVANRDAGAVGPVTDRVSVTFDDDLEANIPDGEVIRFTISDQDPDEPEFLFNCNVRVTTEMVRGHLIGCSSGDQSVRAEVFGLIR